jgi:tetratricopeptide (TPR) repeat protein
LGDATENHVSFASVDTIVQAGSIGELHLHQGPIVEPLTPHQLPTASRWLIGRDRALKFLDTGLRHFRLDDAEPIFLIEGAAGVGKTALAVRWLRSRRAEFPGGQLYVDLRGFDPFDQPLAAEQVLQALLVGLGVDPRRVPAETSAAAGLFHSAMAGRRACLLLDNAADPSQVLSVLPGDESCVTVVTSRRRLASLELRGAATLTLRHLPSEAVREIFVRSVGQDNWTSDFGVAQALVDCCDGLPLAAMIIAARAAVHTDWGLESLANELTAEATRLSGMDTGDEGADIRAAIRSSYRWLDTRTASAFRFIGCMVGDDISTYAAASLFGVDNDHACALLRGLTRINLLTEHRPGRYQAHSLVRLYAAELAAAELIGTERDGARRRLIDFYIATGHRADALLYPHRSASSLPPLEPGSAPKEITESESLSWFDSEHANLMAALHAAEAADWHDRVRPLGRVMDTYLYRRGYLDDRIDVARTSVAAADFIGTVRQRLQAHRQYGRAATFSGDHETAAEEIRRALELAQEIGDPLELGHTYHDSSRLHSFAGATTTALEEATLAVANYREADNDAGRAHALNALGLLHARLEEFETAGRCCQEALALHRAQHNRGGETVTLDNLGYIAACTGEFSVAVAYYQDSLTLCREDGDRYFEEKVQAHLAEAEAAAGTRLRPKAQFP